MARSMDRGEGIFRSLNITDLDLSDRWSRQSFLIRMRDEVRKAGRLTNALQPDEAWFQRVVDAVESLSPDNLGGMIVSAHLANERSQELRTLYRGNESFDQFEIQMMYQHSEDMTEYAVTERRRIENYLRRCMILSALCGVLIFAVLGALDAVGWLRLILLGGLFSVLLHLVIGAISAFSGCLSALLRFSSHRGYRFSTVGIAGSFLVAFLSGVLGAMLFPLAGLSAWFAWSRYRDVSSSASVVNSVVSQEEGVESEGDDIGDVREEAVMSGLSDLGEVGSLGADDFSTFLRRRDVQEQMGQIPYFVKDSYCLAAWTMQNGGEMREIAQLVLDADPHSDYGIYKMAELVLATQMQDYDRVINDPLLQAQFAEVLLSHGLHFERVASEERARRTPLLFRQSSIMERVDPQGHCRAYIAGLVVGLLFAWGVQVPAGMGAAVCCVFFGLGLLGGFLAVRRYRRVWSDNVSMLRLALIMRAIWNACWLIFIAALLLWGAL